MSFAVTAISLAVVSTGLSVYGQMEAAATAKKVGKYNAKVAENQALQTEMDAAENIRRQRIANRKAMSMQMGKFAKAGVVINEGTPLELLSESAATLELEVQDYNRNARVQGQNLRAQGAMSIYTGNQQAQAYQIGAASTLLSGASSVAGMGYNMGTKPGGGVPSGAGSTSFGSGSASSQGLTFSGTTASFGKP